MARSFRLSSRSALTGLLVVPVLLLSAVSCLSEGGSAGDGEAVLERPIEISGDPSELLIFDDVSGGYSKGGFYATHVLPTFALYADGLLIVGPENPFSYELRQLRISERGMRDLITGLDEIGLFAAPLECFWENSEDAPSRILDLTYGTTEAGHFMYPPECDDVPALTQGIALLDQYRNPPEDVLLEPEGPLEYSRVWFTIHLWDSAACEGADPLPPELDSPDLAVSDSACVELPREDAPFTPADPDYDDRYFSQDELCWQVAYHPLLPHELGCGD